MIVEMTSLTPRVTLSTPAIPAHSEPTSIATRMIANCVQRRRQHDLATDGRREQRGEPVLARRRRC